MTAHETLIEWLTEKQTAFQRACRKVSASFESIDKDKSSLKTGALVDSLYASLDDTTTRVSFEVASCDRNAPIHGTCCLLGMHYNLSLVSSPQKDTSAYRQLWSFPSDFRSADRVELGTILEGQSPGHILRNLVDPHGSSRARGPLSDPFHESSCDGLDGCRWIVAYLSARLNSHIMSSQTQAAACTETQELSGITAALDAFSSALEIPETQSSHRSKHRSVQGICLYLRSLVLCIQDDQSQSRTTVLKTIRETALHIVEEALSLLGGTRFCPALYLRGYLLYKMGRYSEAGEMFQVCVEQKYKQEMSANMLGCAYLRMGLPVQAIETLKLPLARHFVNSLPNVYNIGLQYFNLGNWGAAKQMFMVLLKALRAEEVETAAQAYATNAAREFNLCLSMLFSQSAPSAASSLSSSSYPLKMPPPAIEGILLDSYSWVLPSKVAVQYMLAKICSTLKEWVDSKSYFQSVLSSSTLFAESLSLEVGLDSNPNLAENEACKLDASLAPAATICLEYLDVLRSLEEFDTAVEVLHAPYYRTIFSCYMSYIVYRLILTKAMYPFC